MREASNLEEVWVVRRLEGTASPIRDHVWSLLLLALSACTPGPGEPAEVVLVIEVVDERFRVLLTSSDTLQQARELMESGESRVLMGRLAAGDGGFNVGYGWHLEPESIGFHDVAIEVCDGLPSHVEENLQYWLGTVRIYCPWSSRIVGEVRARAHSSFR